MNDDDGGTNTEACHAFKEVIFIRIIIRWENQQSPAECLTEIRKMYPIYEQL